VENRAGKPNELKDSCSVWEEILNLQKRLDKKSTFIEQFIK